MSKVDNTQNSGADEELVTVAVFPEPASANLARTVLEGAGMPVFLQGENANSLIPVAFMARLQVLPRDEARARELLAEAELNPATMEEVSAAEQQDEADRL
jgi:hypothetical protein